MTAAELAACGALAAVRWISPEAAIRHARVTPGYVDGVLSWLRAEERRRRDGRLYAAARMVLPSCHSCDGMS